MNNNSIQLNNFKTNWDNFYQLMIKIHQQGIKKLQHFNYPFRLFLEFLEKINKNILNRCKSNQHIIPMSDILYFITPRFCKAHKQIILYLKNVKNDQNKNQKCQQICKNLKLLKYLEQNQKPNQIIILNMPIKIIQIQILFIFQTWKKNIQQNNNSQIIQNQIQNLKRAIKLYQMRMNWVVEQQNIQMQEKEIRNVIIQQQFKVDQKLSKREQKYGLRLRLIALLKKRASKAQKRIQQRKMSILQVIDGQRKYIDVLHNYIIYIKHPIEKLSILSEQQTCNLFSNIEPIKQFHELFYQELQQKYDKHHKYQMYGDIILKKVSYFKLYVDYIYIAEKAQQFLMNLQQTNQKVAEICRKFLQEKERKGSGQLMQPTFRIARYQALYDQIIKKTNPDHPDYTKMVSARIGFKKILTEVNDTVDKIMRRNRFNQLEQQLGTKEEPVFKSHREYLNQFNLFMIRDDKLQPIILYCFTDALLICEQPGNKKLKWINIDENFYVRREQDSKTYKNMIKILSNGFLTLSTGVEQKHIKKTQQIFSLLKNISKQMSSQQLVFVQVLGTQEIGSTSFAKYTQYVIEIRYMQLKKLLHLRFSEMDTITCAVQAHYKNNLNINVEEKLKKTWFNNHKSKIIEDRKRNIQQILQKIFNHPLTRENPKFLLEILGLSSNFFEVAKKMIQQKSLSITSQSSLKLSNREQRQALTILCATQIKLGRDTYHDVDDKMNKVKQNSQKIDIYINTMVGSQPVIVKITQFDTIQDVCNKLSKLIGLRSNRDFRLFHQIGKKQLRVLEHEQILMSIFTFPKKIQQNSSQTFFQTFTSSIKKVIAPDKHPTLVFKKYYFLPFEIQQRQVKKDLTRLRLLTYQVFQEVKEMKYQLSFDDYLMMASMLVYIEQNGSLQLQTDLQIFNKIIPETILKLKNLSSHQWLEKIQPHIKRINLEIQKVIEHNKQQLKTSKIIQKGGVSKTALYFGHKHLCSQIVLNKIKQNPVYGSNLFYVQPYKTTYESLKEKEHKMTYNMWLAIKVQSLKLLTPTSKETVLELKYCDIEKIFVYSESIVFKMDMYINAQYRLDTYQSFQISQLVKYNKALNDTLHDLNTDLILASRAKFYKDELTTYRLTYDKNEGQNILENI